MKKLPVIISCEHAGHQVPTAYQSLFANDAEVLQTHKGWDIGALSIAQYLSQTLEVPLFYEETTRLLIEMNRSPDNPFLFSKYSDRLTPAQRQKLIQEIYLPYRRKVIDALERVMLAGETALHYSVHTFTPVLGTEVRTTDIGILFDPAQPLEAAFANSVQDYLSRAMPDKQIDFNKPYLGTEDGFTTFLRKVYPAKSYCGIEIEVNQKYAGSRELPLIQQSLSASLQNFYPR